jgi:hypothetical protein
MHGLSIVIVDDVNNLPSHSISDKKGNCITSYYDHVMFIDLSTLSCVSPMKKLLPKISAEMSKNWASIRDAHQALRNQWIASICSIVIAGYKISISGPVEYRASLMTDRIYVPIVILQNGNLSVGQNLEDFDLDKYDLTTVKKWAGSMLGESQDILMKHNVYWIDEHPQLAVSLAVCLTSQPAPLTASGIARPPSTVPVIDSATLADDMAGLSDHLVHNLRYK